MKRNRILHMFWMIFVASIAGGCASSPSHFYTLNSIATGSGAPVVDCSVVVGPVSIPASVDRPQFTLQAGANSIEIEEFNRWAEPLSGNIARVVAGDLRELLGTGQVATSGLVNFHPAYRVSIDIQKFESVRGKEVVDEATWVIRRMADGHSRAGNTLVREPAQGDGFDALAAAHSRALAKMSGDIAAAIRKEGCGQAGEGTAPSSPPLKGADDEAAGQ
jgi:uncharacterized lipoprotein YmbA